MTAGRVRNEARPSRPPAELFPEAVTDNVWRCGFNARSSFGAHSYFVTTPVANLLVDSPRYAGALSYSFEWVLPGHGWPVHREASDLRARLQGLVARMKEA